MDRDEFAKYIKDEVEAWNERAEIARRQKQDDVVSAALKLATSYQEMLPTDEDGSGNIDLDAEADFMKEANLLRKQIESSEQHRTMCVEHGLSDAAIDATYEIQALERKLVALVK